MPNFLIIKHPCCQRALGAIFESDGVVGNNGLPLLCVWCREVHAPMATISTPSGGRFPRAWVIPLPPPETLEDADRTQELTKAI